MAKVCEGCGQTRWEGRQVEGFVDSLNADNAALRELLREAMEYAAHASWRCEHAPHYYLADGPPADGDCPCGLLTFEQRVADALA